MIATALAALPMEPDAMEPDAILDAALNIDTDIDTDNDALDNDDDVQVSKGSCRAVCYKDGCKGTWTNPIPRNKKWHTIRKKYKNGCCAWGRGKCDLCCSTAAPTPAPSPRPTRTPTF